MYQQRNKSRNLDTSDSLILNIQFTYFCIYAFHLKDWKQHDDVPHCVSENSLFTILWLFIILEKNISPNWFKDPSWHMPFLFEKQPKNNNKCS
jgi:hypothetical protein